jgi:hypothetical protein
MQQLSQCRRIRSPAIALRTPYIVIHFARVFHEGATW